jgi:beta-aspartyl-peptidase (threonine type)
MNNKYAIALHGGAGTILRSHLTPEKELAYKTALGEALEVGESILKKGGNALDAIEQTVISLENCPLFNAGKGAVFTYDGKHEMDASIMSGIDLSAGAVSGINHVKNPVKLARAIMEKTEHVYLSGNGALEFAHKIKAELENDDYFYVQMRHDQWKEAQKSDGVFLDHNLQQNENGEKKFGTVGAVALDVHGNLAAATSTGGMTNKKFGRVGDSPIIGAGTYANNATCAISCTGHGEFFIRSIVAYDISCLMEYAGLSLKQACDKVVKDKLVKIGGEGGLVAVDKFGNIELSFNSEGMYRAMKTSESDAYVGIYE